MMNQSNHLMTDYPCPEFLLVQSDMSESWVNCQEGVMTTTTMSLAYEGDGASAQRRSALRPRPPLLRPTFLFCQRPRPQKWSQPAVRGL